MGSLYRHFKGGIYRILYDEVYDCTKCTRMVVYKSESSNKIWARPYDEFFEELDKNKYPNAGQIHRFEPLCDEKYEVCPRCGNRYSDYPAISRVDNKTHICPECGMIEALEAAGAAGIEVNKDIHKLIDEVNKRRKSH